MKVLICIPLLEQGGTEVQTLNTVRALVQGGHEVTVACYFEHTPYMIGQFEEAGAKVILFSPDGNRLSGWRIIPFLYKNLRRAIKTVRPDVVHVQYMTPGALVILLLWLMGVKNIIATAHTAADIYKDLRLIYFLQRHCLRAWTCITERAERSFYGTSQLYSKDTILQKRNHFTIYNCLAPGMVNGERGKVNGANAMPRMVNGDGLKVNGDNAMPGMVNGEWLKVKGENTTHYTLNSTQEKVNGEGLMVNGQNTTHYTLNSKQEPSTHDYINHSPLTLNHSFTLGLVSRLEHIKGMDLVIPAFAEVRKRFRDVKLLVVGDGSLRSSMEQQARDLGCWEHITWAGRQPQEELSKYYNQMDVVLMPSRSEGFGLTAIEAMSHGCVVVASNIGGLPEVVCDGECGLLHQSEDVADMASKISMLISNNELYKRLQTQSLREVKKYSFERYAELMNDLYMKVNG